MKLRKLQRVTVQERYLARKRKSELCKLLLFQKANDSHATLVK